jgi:serine protease Do
VAVDTEELAGSGWILTTDGLIVTNNHVIEGAGAVTITLAGGQTYTGKTIWTDAIDDLAVVDIGVTGLPAARVGDSSKMSVGDWVVAIGNAQGEGISATQGTICCTDSCFRVGTQETLYHTLEITAPITYGNSGGPLLNMDGEVIGIVTGGELTRNGTQVAGYAISSNAAQQIIRDFIENGYVTRAWLGVNVSSVTDLALTGWQPPVENGAFVIKVEADSPAGQAGLAAGDVILNFGGREMNSADDLVEAVRDTEIGQPVTIAYWRDNNENTVIANLVQTPANYTK